MSNLKKAFDPIFYHSGGRIQDRDDPNATTPIEPAGWYFWDESWAYYHGPKDSRKEAEESLDFYCKEVLG